MTKEALMEKAAQHYAAACKASRQWDAAVIRAVKTYGRRPKGGHVSGIYSEHFPEAVQKRLRRLAHRVTEQLDLGYACRPKRVRLRTMINLAHAIARRDGCGYYGPCV